MLCRFLCTPARRFSKTPNRGEVDRTSPRLVPPFIITLKRTAPLGIVTYRLGKKIIGRLSPIPVRVPSGPSLRGTRPGDRYINTQPLLHLLQAGLALKLNVELIEAGSLISPVIMGTYGS